MAVLCLLLCAMLVTADIYRSTVSVCLPLLISVTFLCRRIVRCLSVVSTCSDYQTSYPPPGLHYSVLFCSFLSIRYIYDSHFVYLNIFIRSYCRRFLQGGYGHLLSPHPRQRTGRGQYRVGWRRSVDGHRCGSPLHSSSLFSFLTELYFNQ
jgi:hypothetical protein